MEISIFSGMAKKLTLYRIMDITKEIGYSGILGKPTWITSRNNLFLM